MLTKTLIVLLTSAATCLVENVIALVPGTPFEPPLGRVLLTVPRDLYVGPGFTGTLLPGGWTWAAPPIGVEPPAPVNVLEQVELLEASNTAQAAQIAALRAALG